MQDVLLCRSKYRVWCIDNNISAPEYFIEDVNKAAETNPEFKGLADLLNKMDKEVPKIEPGINDKETFINRLSIYYNLGMFLCLEQIYLSLIINPYDEIENNKSLMYNHDNMKEFIYREYSRDYDHFISKLYIVLENPELYLKEIYSKRYKKCESIDVINIDIPIMPKQLLED